jgi:hypothetical protein
MRDAAAAELGRARARTSDTGSDAPSVETLRVAWERMGTQDRRELLALRLDTIAARRDGLTVYPAGTAPADLPRRGYRKSPSLRPFPDASQGARLVALT